MCAEHCTRLGPAGRLGAKPGLPPQPKQQQLTEEANDVEGSSSHPSAAVGAEVDEPKASPEARSSRPPSQPLQMLSLLSARAVVSIPHGLLCQSWPRRLGEVEARVQGSVQHMVIQFRANIPLVSDLIIDSPDHHSPALGSTRLGNLGWGGKEGRKMKTKIPSLFIKGTLKTMYWSPECHVQECMCETP